MRRMIFPIWCIFITVYFSYVLFTQRPEFIIHKDQLILTRSDDAFAIYIADTRNMNSEDYYAVAVHNKTQKIIPIQNISQLYRMNGSYNFLFDNNDSVYFYSYYSVERHNLKSGAKTTVLPKFSESYFKNSTTNEVAYQLHSFSFSEESNEFVAIYTDNPMKRKEDFSLLEKLSVYIDIYDGDFKLIETIDLDVMIEPYEGVFTVYQIQPWEIRIGFNSDENPASYRYNRNVRELKKVN